MSFGSLEAIDHFPNTDPVNVDYVTDDLLSKYSSYNEFTEFEEEGYQKIVFLADNSVRDFRFIQIGYEDEAANIYFFESKELYSLPELSPEKPLVVTWMQAGTIPHRGITFVDEENISRYFYITMSGEDGSLRLVEFSNNASQSTPTTLFGLPYDNQTQIKAVVKGSTDGIEVRGDILAESAKKALEQILIMSWKTTEGDFIIKSLDRPDLSIEIYTTGGGIELGFYGKLSETGYAAAKINDEWQRYRVPATEYDDLMELLGISGD